MHVDKEAARSELMEEEDLLLTAAYAQLQIMKKTRHNRKKMRDWLQHRVLYGQYEKLVAELREEDAIELFQANARTWKKGTV